MTDAIKLAIEQAWDKFCEGFDLHSNEWLDKGSGEMFEAGYIAALRAQPDHSELVRELRYVGEWAEYHLDKAQIINAAADALEGKAIGEATK